MRDNKKLLSRSHKYLRISPKSDNTLSTGKMGYDVSCFQANPSCFVHGGEYITHFCQNCDYKPLCGLCLKQGFHKSHEVSNVEKANKKVERVIKQTLVALNSKEYFLKILNDYLEAKRNDVDKQFQDYIKSINDYFEAIEICLEQKKASLLKSIQTFYDKSVQKIIEANACSKQERNKTKQMMDILSEKGQKLDPANLCIYYYEKKEILQATKEQGNAVYEQLKNMVPDFKWLLNADLFEQLKNQINNISTKSNTIQISLKTTKVQMEKRKSTSKSKQKSFLKSDKIGVTTNSSGYWTPKNNNTYSNKALHKFFKDSDNQKLMALVPNDSIEKPHRPVDLASNSLLLKKGKGKLKQDKNN